MENNEKLLINGLAGRRELFGRLAVTGAKNSILKGLAASLLFGDRLTLTAVPDILDVRHMISLLADLGVGIDSVDDGYVLDPTNIGHSVINPTMAKHLRASVVLSGPLLARTGQVTFPHPGGCVIGKRPIDFFLEGFRLMGATVEDCDSAYKLTAPGGKLKGAEIFFKVPSVTGTETFMMAAVLAEGETVLKNAALEPEIIGLGEFLRQSGARIYGLGTPTIRISGGGLLTGAGQPFRPISDRIEAGSFIILSALCAKDVVVENINTDHLDALLHALHLAGVKLEVTPTTVRVKGRQPVFSALDIKTHEYPGFPTDLQAPMAVFLTQSAGQSYIFETIFEGRLNYLETLGQMGAEARIIDVHRALITGPTPLAGREMESPDLRAGLAYLLAGLVADGQSVVHNVYYIDRGYQEIDKRLQAIGADITRVKG